MYLKLMSLQRVLFLCWLSIGDVNAHFSIQGPHTAGGHSPLIQDLWQMQKDTKVQFLTQNILYHDCFEQVLLAPYKYFVQMQSQCITISAVAANDPAKHHLKTICFSFTEDIAVLTVRIHVDFQCCQSRHNIIFSFCVFKVKSSVTLLLHTVADEPANVKPEIRQTWMKSLVSDKLRNSY